MSWSNIMENKVQVYEIRINPIPEWMKEDVYFGACGVGFSACLEGVGIAYNPYECGTDKYQDWLDGYGLGDLDELWSL